MAVDGVAVAVAEVQQRFGDLNVTHQGCNVPYTVCDAHRHATCGACGLSNDIFNDIHCQSSFWRMLLSFEGWLRSRLRKSFEMGYEDKQ